MCSMLANYKITLITLSIWIVIITPLYIHGKHIANVYAVSYLVSLTE